MSRYDELKKNIGDVQGWCKDDQLGTSELLICQKRVIKKDVYSFEFIKLIIAKVFAVQRNFDVLQHFLEGLVSINE